MKYLAKTNRFKLVVASVMMTFINAVAFAQDSVEKTSSTVSTSTTTWYAEPWAWALGAAVLIIILVALLRGSGGTTDRVTVTKKVEHE